MMESKVVVYHEGEVLQSSDFVAFLATEDGGGELVYDCDAATMGQAAKLCAMHFLQLWEDIMDGNLRRELMELFGPAFEKAIWIINDGDAALEERRKK